MICIHEKYVNAKKGLYDLGIYRVNDPYEVFGFNYFNVFIKDLENDEVLLIPHKYVIPYFGKKQLGNFEKLTDEITINGIKYKKVKE